MANRLDNVAEQLNQWFLSVSHLTEESLFNFVPEGPHRDAVVLDALKRNARDLSQRELDREGKLYSPICFFLAAACRTLATPLAVGHWRAALHTVVNMERHGVIARKASQSVGLEVGSPAAIFKQELDEAITQAGVAGGVSYLGKEDRLVALGLAINWGMRFLLAYALECSLSTKNTGRRDLAWVADLMEPLMAATGSSR